MFYYIYNYIYFVLIKIMNIIKIIQDLVNEYKIYIVGKSAVISKALDTFYK